MRILDADTYKQRIEDLFQGRAGRYDTGDTYHPPLAERLLSVAAIQPGERSFDVATGTGLVRPWPSKLCDLWAVPVAMV